MLKTSRSAVYARNSNTCISVAGCLLLCAAGCASKESQLVGHWKFKDVQMAASSPYAGMARSLFGSWTIDLKADKTFSMNLMVAIEGTWSLSGSTVSMTPTKIMGMSIDQFKSNPQVAQTGQDPGKPITATLSDDGKTLSVTGKTGGQGSVTLTKDSS